MVWTVVSGIQEQTDNSLLKTDNAWPLESRTLEDIFQILSSERIQL